MKKIIKIKRQKTVFDRPYWQSFAYEGSDDISIAGLLDHINYNDDLCDIDNKPASRIAWECSCLQAMCGSCAMVINGRPALACETFLRDLGGNEITIEPLSKFMVISDLVVDRGVIHENLKKAGTYIEKYRGNVCDDAKPGKVKGVAGIKKEFEQEYTVAKCLKCGLCLEVCPNYGGGKEFFGALFANDAYLVAARSAEHGEKIKAEYDAHFAATCSKSLSCMEVCPMKIQTIASMSRLNRISER